MRLKLRTKVLGGFIGVAMIGVIIGITGIAMLGYVSDHLHEISDVRLPSIESLFIISEAQTAVLAGERGLINHRVTDKAVRDAQYAYIADAFARADAAWKKYEPLDQSEKEAELWQKFVPQWEKWKKYHASVENWQKEKDRFLAMGIEVDDSRIEQLDADSVILSFGDGRDSFLTAEAILNELITENEELTVQLEHESDQAVAMANVILVASLLIGFAISILLALWLGIRVISKPLIKISDTLSNGSVQIASASNQLSSSAQEIANGATEQASSIEETTSSMEELASMVRQNLQNAKEASTLADKASTSSRDGFGQMEKMLDSMEDINKSSDQISKVIKIIDDIAFQTNILALNAAVEAARAGEAGMGFAVVADEVKNLANKSASAAKETSGMIEDSIKKTEEGLGMAKRLADVFKEILGNSQKVAEMSKEVETASTQQDAGINQVNKAIVQFDEVVQANASSAEETASSAEELQAQVETMNTMVIQLEKLVNGKAKNDNGHAAIEPRAVKHMEIAHHAALKPRTKTTVRSAGRKEVSPEHLIPFEEDEEFKNADKD